VSVQSLSGVADDAGLVVWAIAEARSAAIQVDAFLTGASRLPQVGGIVKRDWKTPDVEVDITVKSVHSGSSSGANSDAEIEVDASQLSE
jgi:hypothetical protein